MDEILFSSRSDEWGTPKWLFDRLNDSFDFTLDPCANPYRLLLPVGTTKRNISLAEDGLLADWTNERVFINPPYSKVGGKSQAGLWCSKLASERVQLGVVLIPARTDTLMWHECVFRYAESVLFLRGRLKFDGSSNNSAPFPSAIAFFGAIGRHMITPFEDLGAICWLR